MTSDCPKCGSVATNITPTKSPTSVKVFGCAACGYAFTEDGKPVVQNNKQLADVFKAATEGQKTIMDVFGGSKMDPVTRSVMTTKLLEYGVQMWFDGLKQGILLGTIQEMKNDGENGSEERDII
jgi:transcription elongation factor Elf1